MICFLKKGEELHYPLTLTFYGIEFKVLLIFNNGKRYEENEFVERQIKVKSKIDYKEIIKIIDLLEERNLSHFELEVEGFKIKISRDEPQTLSSKYIPSSSLAPVPKEKETASSPDSNTQEGEDSLHYITSPMVGTFYRASDPSSPPFVDVGETVETSQTLCIIEAMKLMNEIESDIDGEITEIFIKNGKPVEYGQRLFAIKPS